MASSKKRSVKFYSPILETDSGGKKFVDDDFWTEFLDYVSAADKDDRRISRNGRPLLGIAKDHGRTALRYLYLGKKRPKGDYPDDFGPTGDSPESLAFNASVSEIAEPAYIVPTGIGTTVAVLRSTGGPRVEDIEFWVSNMSGIAAEGENFVLSAVVSKKQWELLQSAELVSKLEVKLQKGVDHDFSARGQISRAVERAVEVAGEDATVEMAWSFGHGIPDTLAGRAFTDDAKAFLEDGEYEKAVATLKIPAADGTWRTESVNFVKEVVTHQVRVGDSENEPLTEDLVLPEIQGAIMDNRDFLRA